MPLQRATKSVIFHEGLSDGTDQFLLEPPSVDYVENLQPGDGSFQKRMGFGPTELTSVPGAIGEPFFIHAIKDQLYVLDEAGAKSFDGTSWTSTNPTEFIGTKSVAVSTPIVHGLAHVTWAPYTGSAGEKYYVVAFEVRERSSSDPSLGTWVKTPKHVMIQTYNEDGRFLYQTRIEDAQSPKIRPGPNDPLILYVFYQRVSNNELEAAVYIPGIGSIIATKQTGLNPAYTFGMESHASRDYPSFPSNADDKAMWWTRFPASMDGHCRYEVLGDPFTNTWVILLTTEVSGIAGKVELHRMTELFTISQSRSIFTPIVYNAPPYAFRGADTGEALAMCLIPGGNVAVMWGEYQSGRYTGQHDPSAGAQSFVRIQRYGIANLGPVWSPQTTIRQDAGGIDYTGRVYTHGALLYNSNDLRIHWFLHDSGESMNQSQDGALGGVSRGAVAWENVRQESGLRYGRLASVSGTPQGFTSWLRYHRLVTKPVLTGGEVYACVQQWHDCTPRTEDPDNFNNWATVLPSANPKTTVLLHIDFDDQIVRPVAYVDPAGSKFSEYVESEFLTHLPEMIVDQGDFVFANRVAIAAEDASLKIHALPSSFRTMLGSGESPSPARVRIHRVTKGFAQGREIHGASFGDGIAIGTAIPLWFDGKFFGEMSPLDQPEIASVTDARLTATDKATPQGFGIDDKGPSALSWRKLQIVCGYFDAKGNKHRSAPSSTVYVGLMDGKNADPDDADEPTTWIGKDVTVAFTPPLSMLPDDLEYFIEVYASNTVEDDPLLLDVSTYQPSRVGTGIFRAMSEVVVQLVRFTGASVAPQNSSFEVSPRTAQSIYTSGGGLAATPWPDFSKSVVTSTRFWALDAVNKGRVLPSKLFEEYIAPEYNSTLAINLGDERDLTAIGKLDDKVIVFERNDIHVIYGEGPDNRGQGQDFAVHYISTDVGCEDQQSLIETPIGLVFYSKPRGFYMVDRNLQVQFIGSGVETIARDIDVISATLVPEFGEVRFIVSKGDLTPDLSDQIVEEAPRAVLVTGVYNPPRARVTNALPTNPCLVFNYEKQAWSVYSNYAGSAATIYQNRYTILKPDWSIWQESPTRYDDPTGTNRTVLRTPWIRLSEQIQNYARLWRVTFLGRYFSSLQDLGGGVYEAGDVIVRAWFDYEQGPTAQMQEKRYRFQDFGFDIFNAVDLRSERFQFRWTPARGRCQAVKFEIEEVQSEDRGEGLTYGLGAGFEIVSADFEIGVATNQTRYLQKAVSK